MSRQYPPSWLPAGPLCPLRLSCMLDRYTSETVPRNPAGSRPTPMLCASRQLVLRLQLQVLFVPVDELVPPVFYIISMCIQYRRYAPCCQSGGICPCSNALNENGLHIARFSPSNVIKRSKGANSTLQMIRLSTEPGMMTLGHRMASGSSLRTQSACRTSNAHLRLPYWH